MVSAALDNEKVEPETENPEEETSETTDVTEEETPELDNEEEEESDGDDEEDEPENPVDVDLSLDDSSESEEQEAAARWADRFKPDSSLDPAVQERFRQQLDGVQKIVERETLETFKPLINIEQSLRSPERWQAQLERLAEDVQTIHGVPVRIVIGEDQETDDTYELPEVKDVKTKLTATERRLAELEAKLGTREQEERQARIDSAWLSQKGPAAVKLAAQQLGLTVSPDEALKAVKAWPTKPPLDAIFAEYGRTHKSVTTKPKKGGNVMPNTNKGVSDTPILKPNGELDVRALVAKYV